MMCPRAPRRLDSVRRRWLMLGLIAAALVVLIGSVPAVPAVAATATPALVFTVNSTADPGSGACDLLECTLREAINQANLLPGTDTIAFDIAGPGPHTIQPTTPLPYVTDAVVLDGRTEPDFAGSPIVELDGSLPGATGSGITLFAGGSIVRGLAINRFVPGPGQAGGGIFILSGGNNIIEGNYLGTDVTGTVPLGNTSGVLIYGSGGNQVGGTTAAARNIIADNRGQNGVGIWVYSGANVIQGNYIGTDVTGTEALGNGWGIIVTGNDNVVGGPDPGAGNVISGNWNSGLDICANCGGFPATGNVVQGNHIGTDAGGLAAVPNAGWGVGVRASDNTIGGGAPGTGNIISGNNGAGIVVGYLLGNPPPVRDNVIQGNLIGTAADGLTPLGNAGHGVHVGFVSSTLSNTIGGTSNDSANTIAHNGGAGIFVEPNSAENSITGNAIHENGSLGIDLDPSGMTANDDGTGDADTGANNLQNHPKLTSVTDDGQGTITIDGQLDSAPSTTFALEFFSTPACDASGHGEGADLLGTSGATTDNTGIADFSVSLSDTLLSTDAVTATATDPSGNTSEFSVCAFPEAPITTADLSLTATAQTDAPDPVTAGLDVRYLVTVKNLGPDEATGVGLTDTLPAGTTFIEAAASQGTCGPPVTGTIECDLGTLADGASATLSVVVQSPSSAGSITNSASVKANEEDPVSGNDSSSESTTVQARTRDEAHGWVPASGGQRVITTGGRPSPSDTTVTRVIVPEGVEGEVHLLEGSIDEGGCPAPYQCFGQQVDLSAQRSFADPYQLAFTFDDSVVPNVPATRLATLHFGEQVLRCTTPGELGPDPCLTGGRRIMGDLRRSVLSTYDGTWIAGST